MSMSVKIAGCLILTDGLLCTCDAGVTLGEPVAQAEASETQANFLTTQLIMGPVLLSGSIRIPNTR